MKTDIKALPLSVALSFLALLGACASVNSTPDAQIPGADSNSVILESAQEGIETVEDTTSEILGDDTAIETETTDAIEVESAEVETPDAVEIESAETEAPDALEVESAEVETPDAVEIESAETEATDVIEVESAETEAPDALEVESAEIEIEEDTAIDTDAIEVESAEEINPTEIILPEGDTAEVETESEAAEIPVIEAAPAE